MLRWVSYALDFVAGCLVLLAPLVLIHWLLVAFQIAPLGDWLAPVSDGLQPIYDGMEGVFPFPRAEAGGWSVSTAPLALGVLLLLGFFITSFVAGVLRQVEVQLSSASRPNYAVQAQQRATQQQLAVQQEALQRSAIVVWVEYPFAQFAQSGQLLMRYSQYGGQELPAQYNAPTEATPAKGCGVVFNSAVRAMSYAQQSLEKLQAYYSGMGGGETLPPVRLVLDAAVPSAHTIQTSMVRCQFIARYCQPNQILFSQQLYERMQAENVAQQFAHYSMGVYQLPNEAPQDLYCLEVQAQSLFF
ncbi:MAG: hypothetical protein U0003_00375 [Vampirovibrionales bacterium]